MKKKITNILILALVSVFSLAIGASAATTIASTSVSYGDTTVQAALDELMDIATSKCAAGYLCSNASVGDYVRMTPTLTSYHVEMFLTGVTSGYTSDFTINPSELNLWRIISINNDGTIDMVSEYVSSKPISFQGTSGFSYLVYTLNLIAKQYENSKYTVGSRHMGYNGQTQVITDTSKFVRPAPWTSGTIDNSNEFFGGGDMMYERDVDLVTHAIGTLVATTPEGIASGYWLASREYFYTNANFYGWDGRNVTNRGSLNTYSVLYGSVGSAGGAFSYVTNATAIRPIVTLKSDIQATGSGTSDAPWVLS